MTEPFIPHMNISWMKCANNECGQAVVRLHDQRTVFTDGVPHITTDAWLVYPRHDSNRPVDPAVPSRYREDYVEAAAVLNVSPRLSAVMSRRILTDLLADYAKLTQHSLANRIDAFNQNTGHPHHLRENLHYLREIGDFVAHTMKDDQANIVGVDSLEAEWTLEIIDRLFDYFIVTPKRDTAMREGVDEKLRLTKRKPIKPLPNDTSGQSKA
ncbi:MAG: DUF4145 domain-containing protein [Chloroflexota bacterium]